MLVWEGEVGAHLLRCKAAGQKDLAGLGEWVKRNVFKWKKCKCKFLHLGWTNPIQQQEAWLAAE